MESDKIEDIIAEVKAASVEVYDHLLNGFAESVYEKALAHEFRLRGIAYTRQEMVEVLYKDEVVGTMNLDFVVERSLVLELKTGSSISAGHRNQIRAYMRQRTLKDGMIVNFPANYSADGPQFEPFDQGGYVGIPEEDR